METQCKCEEGTVTTFPDGRRSCDSCDYSFNPYRGKFFVNLYHSEQAYGGPEEGGWWFDTGVFLRCAYVTTSRERALMARDKVRRRLVDKLNEGLPEKHSVISQGVLEIQVDEFPGHDYPETRPFYC